MNIHQNIHSHKLFFERITENKLNELLFRVTHGQLRNDIKNELVKNDIHNIIVNTKLLKDENNLYSIYINYYTIPENITSLTKDIILQIINDDNNKRAHISFHIFPKNPDYKKSKIGRIHAINNKKGLTHTIKLSKNSQLFKLELTHNPFIMTNEFQRIIQPAIDVLNRYFVSNPKSQNFLGNSTLLKNKKIHPILSKIKQTVYTNFGRKMSTTRKH